MVGQKKQFSSSGPELPSHFADRMGITYAKDAEGSEKKAKGQFFTPLEIAELMGELCDSTGKEVSILDPGCGTGILSCSLIESLVRKNPRLKNIELTLFETDQQLLPVIANVIKFLKKWLSGKGITLKHSINPNDFVLENGHYLSNAHNLFLGPPKTYDIVISNPPYFKLPITDARALAAQVVINGHPNIYSIFMAIASQLLNEDGQLVFITPRSYASGGYFKSFREFFFKRISLDKIHLFNSRKDTFNKDKVLQETVIIKGSRTKSINPDREVRIYSSNGLRDIGSPHIKVFPQRELIDLDSNEKILHIPTNDKEERILTIFRNWSGNLNKYNIQISTGPVVSFRASDFIREIPKATEDEAPLFWLNNVKQMRLEWPLEIEGKGQYIIVKSESRGLLIPNKNYVLLRRFSAKDDKTRLIAAPYFCNFLRSDYIGVENKVNYIYRPKGHLDRNEIVGICALLNSRLFDSYFRIFNGNVNVSATELREIPLPPLQAIKQLGDSIILSNDFSVENSNKIVNEEFQRNSTTYE